MNIYVKDELNIVFGVHMMQVTPDYRNFVLWNTAVANTNSYWDLFEGGSLQDSMVRVKNSFKFPEFLGWLQTCESNVVMARI